MPAEVSMALAEALPDGAEISGGGAVESLFPWQESSDRQMQTSSKRTMRIRQKRLRECRTRIRIRALRE
jgi:hypothetical protein